MPDEIPYAYTPEACDRALKALQAHVDLRDPAGFRALAASLEAQPELHAPVLAGLILIHQKLQDFARVDALFERAATMRPADEEWHEHFASLALDYGFRDQVEPHLTHVVKRGIPDRVGLLVRLATAYQAVGEHEPALKLFEASEHVDPRLVANEQFLALKAASRQRIGRRERVNSGQVLAALKQRQQTKKALKVVPAVVALVVAAYAAAAWHLGSSRDVWFVNGLEAPYHVTLAGVTHELPPGKATRLSIAEGDLEIRGDGPLATLPVQTTTVRTPFWSRPFSRTVYVVNPDRTAVLWRTHVTYGTSDPSFKVRRDWSAGQLAYAFEDVNCAFVPPPDTLSVNQNDSSLHVRVVLTCGTLKQLVHGDTLKTVRKAIGDDAYLAAMGGWLGLSPLDEAACAVLATACTPRETVTLLGPALRLRPLNLAVHRAYQTAMEDDGRQAEVAAEYAKLSAREPADLVLRYLAARAQPDPDVWMRALDAIAATPGAPDAALYSHVSALLDRGRFADAIEPARKLAGRATGAEIGEFLLWLALEGAGRNEEALERIARDKAVNPVTRYVERCELLAALGREQEARAALARGIGEFTIEESKSLNEHLDGLIAYAAGREEEAGKALIRLQDPSWKATGALMLGSPANAAKTLGADAEADMSLAIYLTWCRQGKAEDPAAKQALAQAIAGLRQHNGPGGRAAAAALEGHPTIPAARLVLLYAPTPLKPTLLATLGLRCPADRETYFDMARTLNVKHAFPQLLVKAIVGEPKR